MTEVPDAGHHTPDANAFVALLETISNDALADEWIGLYAPDATVEWIVDGSVARYHGIDEIGPAVEELTTLWRALHLRVRTTVACSDATTVALTYTGGFDGKVNQRGAEIWTFRDQRVVRHQMFAYLNVLPEDSFLGRLRVAAMSPRVAFTVLTQRTISS
ncbi:nuclear transport factor 2 family protein [Gordonia sp. ABSL11-1]|uniref:nuclear transport factor 2 family protein n=1 Tax=Gordonia sp. ABSL11-1 TaxID=3053924 RepID=UPI002573F3B4|nr:nuclear transport factor 2 family protein [Gordonia sp. ABSL11-1]MDL9948664.1 nuclear transport factor 2 family protein [Gordonia sp. ABSL11-1]